jgi:hypothetical protein
MTQNTIFFYVELRIIRLHPHFPCQTVLANSYLPYREKKDYVEGREAWSLGRLMGERECWSQIRRQEK